MSDHSPESLTHPCSHGAQYVPDDILAVVTINLIVFSKDNPSLGGNKYWISFTVPNALGFHFGFGVDGQFIKSWFLDKGGENHPQWFLDTCAEEGVVFINSGTQEHQSMGLEEGWHCIAMDRHQALTLAASAPTDLW
ncbi:UNVERIFIED_CONTAM: hypothetical protein HDU68_005909, partial [Siphonaria sp. JEL0065]